MLETRLLRYFLAVAEELHFGRAAERLHISQPPLSQQIMKLEEELGTKLFVRTKREVRLTRAGEVLKQDAQDILCRVGVAQRHVREAAAGQRGRLSLGYVGPAMETRLPEIIKAFKQVCPKVSLELNQKTSREQVKEIGDGQLDVGVVRLFGRTIPGLECLPFHRERYALALACDHPLTLKKEIRIMDLAGEPLIFFPRKIQPRLYDAWFKIFDDHGIAPDIVQEATYKQTAVALVAAGLGISMVPESMARSPRKGVVVKKLSGDLPEVVLSLVYKKGADHSILERFLSLANPANPIPG
ncbi:MAG: LysR family transcriptional regulator [Desulfobacterium sp.]|nr:LysR family transcriptional regulator [Desulfobacterium sp.]